MRKGIAAACLLLLPFGAMAQPQDTLPVEIAESNTLDTLTGIWKISFPRLTTKVSLPLMRDGELNFSMGESFCRIAHAGGEEAAVTCIAGGNWRTGSVTLEGGKLRFTLGSMVMRIIIEANYNDPDSFSGLYGVRLLAFSVDADTPATAQRHIGQEDAPDAAGLREAVSGRLKQFADGYVASPTDVIVRRNLGARANTAGEIRGLGPVVAVLYLGEGRHRNWPAKRGDPEPPPFLFSVYQVEFANGQRLCAAHDRGDGVLDGFLCV